MTDTKQLDYIVHQLKWMEENCDDEQTSKNLRRAATQTLDRFSIEGSPFYSDERILYVSMIIGRLSRNIGLKGVMKCLYERRQFCELPEFYINWAKVNVNFQYYEIFSSHFCRNIFCK
ncbi:unnamed protein product [Dracunculus medinensis]|uniref:Uncharacterized protein n=1 Tax=Dracunculus medinensis TaxID=318479 RepID=A0A0N4UA94_DRAME|nr:unnamed protein product [Dracunculus medinensis]